MASRRLTILAHILNPSSKPQLDSSLPPSWPPPTSPPTKPPKKYKKKRKKDSSRTNPVQQHDSQRVPHLEAIVERDAAFRFLTRTKEYLAKQPDHVLRLDDAGILHRELGFPRGRKVLCSIQRHPLLLETYRHDDGKMWFGFTDFMESLLQEEKEIMNNVEEDSHSYPETIDDVVKQTNSFEQLVP